MSDFDQIMKEPKRELVKLILDRYFTIESAVKIEFAEGTVKRSASGDWIAEFSDGAIIKTVFPTIEAAHSALINNGKFTD